MFKKILFGKHVYSLQPIKNNLKNNKLMVFERKKLRKNYWMLEMCYICALKLTDLLERT